MEEIYDQCNSFLGELYKFSQEVLHLGPEIKDNRIELLEESIGFELPIDFMYIYKKHNGILLSGTEIYGLDKSLLGSSLDEVYRFEHWEADHKMPKELFPFSPDGRGNHYCINLAKNEDGICPIVFWQWDFDYTNFSEIEECNKSFVAWCDEVIIEWTLEDINYDGSDK